MQILLIQLRRLGDLILTTPAIRAIREQMPEAQITLAVTRHCESLLRAVPFLSETLVLRRGLGDLRTWNHIRRTRFAYTIDFTCNDRSAWLTVLAASPHRIVSDRLRKKNPLRARLYNRFVDCAMKQMHTADYNLALLQPLGISGASAEPVLELPAAATQEASRLICEQIVNEPFALFHPGSARREKFWQAARWASAINFAVNELGLKAVLSAGSTTLEQSHVKEIRQHLRVQVIDLSSQVDLLTLAALIARTRLLVTVDSAPMHLASVFKTPQVILFGPTNPFHWRPRNSRAAILFGDSPEPMCEFRPREPKRAMDQISTTAVINAMRSMQSAPAASAV